MKEAEKGRKERGSFGVSGRRGWEAEGEGFLAGMEGAWEPGSPMDVSQWRSGVGGWPKTEPDPALVPITCRRAAGGASVSSRHLSWLVHPGL